MSAERYLYQDVFGNWNYFSPEDKLPLSLHLR